MAFLLPPANIRKITNISTAKIAIPPTIKGRNFFSGEAALAILGVFFVPGSGGVVEDAGLTGFAGEAVVDAPGKPPADDTG